MTPMALRRHRLAARRRIAELLVLRRLDRQSAWTGERLVQASMVRTGRIPTDS
jgi:hypothetical protein